MHWPFGRRTKPSAGRAAPNRPAGGQPAGARPHDAWRSLPAVQRTIGAPPVVAPAAPFAERLATRQAPDLALQPLGHEVSPLAAAGLLIGITAPGDGLNAGRVELPLQRLASDHQPAAGEDAGWSSFDDGSQAPAAPATVLTPAPDAGPDRADGQPAALVGFQRLAPTATLTTSAPTGVAPSPAGVLDLRPAARASEATGPLLSGGPSAASGPAPSPAVPAEPEAPVRRPTLGQARRLGLGAPLLPGSPALQRLMVPEAGSVEQAGPFAFRTAAGRISGQPDAGPNTDPSVRGPSMTTAEPALKSAQPGGAPAGGQGLDLDVVRPRSIQRRDARLPVDLATGEDWPAGGSRRAPLAGLPVEVQRFPDAGPEAFRRTPPGIAPGEVDLASGPVDLADGPGIGRAEPVRLASVRASSRGSLLDRPAAAHRPEDRAAGAAGTGLSADVPVVARSIAGPLPAFGQSSAGALAPAGSASRGPVGPLVQHAPPAPDPSSAEVAGRPGPAPAGPVQRAVEIRELTFPTRAEGPGGTASPGPGGEPAPGVPPVSAADRDRELDDLARRLYGRIRSKLAAELLADRERAGVLVDLR